MSNQQKQFTVTVASLATIAVVAMFAFACIAYFVPGPVVATAVSVGALAAGLSAPIVAMYNRLGRVEAVIQDGQHAAVQRTEAVKEKLDEVVRKVETTMEAMPQTPEQLRAFIMDVMTPVAECAAELAVKKYRQAEDTLRGVVT